MSGGAERAALREAETAKWWEARPEQPWSPSRQVRRRTQRNIDKAAHRTQAKADYKAFLADFRKKK